MTRIKLCGLSRISDIQAANELLPDYIGFVFAAKSSRCVTAERAMELKAHLDPRIRAVGVFVDEQPETAADLLNRGVIDAAQLHGNEDDDYIARLRGLTAGPIIKAFRIKSSGDIISAERSTADLILLDSGAGTGRVFEWELLKGITRPFFLAGGLSPDNIRAAVRMIRPFGVDVSSGIETSGLKDKAKMTAFVNAVRKEDMI